MNAVLTPAGAGVEDQDVTDKVEGRQMDALAQAYVVDLLNRWAKRSRADNIISGYGDNAIARMMKGVPSTRCPPAPRGCGGEGVVVVDGKLKVCPTCEGSCRVNLKPKTTEAKGKVCPQCKGSGEIAREDTASGEDVAPGDDTAPGATCVKCRGAGRVPAPYVKGTISPGAVNPATIFSTRKGYGADSEMLKVERAIMVLPYIHQLVVWQEYLCNGTQEHKAARIGIANKRYRIVLRMAHRLIFDLVRK